MKLNFPNDLIGIITILAIFIKSSHCIQIKLGQDKLNTSDNNSQDKKQGNLKPHYIIIKTKPTESQDNATPYYTTKNEASAMYSPDIRKNNLETKTIYTNDKTPDLRQYVYEKPEIVKYLRKDNPVIPPNIPETYLPVSKVTELSEAAKAELRLRKEFRSDEFQNFVLKGYESVTRIQPIAERVSVGVDRATRQDYNWQPISSDTDRNLWQNIEFVTNNIYLAY